MKYIVNIFRLFVGFLFIFSGLIKSNDPTGFSYKLDEYFSVFASELEADQDSVSITITTLDGANTFTESISANRPIVQVNAKNTEWKPIPMDEPIKDTLYYSDVTIHWENQEIYSTTINTGDDSLVLEATVSCTVNSESLNTETIKLYALQQNDELISFDMTSFVKENSFIVGFLEGMRPYALALAIFLCVLEIVLGLALLIGWAPKLTVTSLILLIIFFTFLTWYSAYFNKVTDCGCFGDAIKLTPWESFYKDVILSVSIVIIALGLKHIKPIFSNPFSVKLLTVFTLLSTGFSVYCWHYLPFKNFLKFKEGNNIEELVVVPEGAPSDVYENVFIYARDGVEEDFTLSQMSERNLKDEGYEFVDRVDKLISKGYEPEIHDFKIMDETRSNDYVEDFFADTTHKVLIVMNEVQNANTESISELKDIIKYCQENDIEIYPLTASSSETVDEFRHEHQLSVPFYYGDKTNLKSIIRSNPGLVLFDGNVVKKNWPSTRLPSIKKFNKAIDK